MTKNILTDMADINDSLTQLYKQNDCQCVTRRNGIQIRRYRHTGKNVRSHYITKPTYEYTHCPIYTYWKDEKFMGWCDIKQDVDLDEFNEKSTFKQSELPSIDAYWKCDREVEYYYDINFYRLMRWKPVTPVSHKYQGKIQLFCCVRDRSDDYYMLFQPMDEFEDPHPTKIYREEVQEKLDECRYIMAPEVDIFCKRIKSEYEDLETRCRSAECEYLRSQVPKMKTKDLLQGVQDRINILEMMMPIQSKPGILKGVFGMKTLMTKLHHLSL